jgi:protein-disulfide isomerase
MNKNLPIIIILFVALLGVGVGFWMYSRPKPPVVAPPGTKDKDNIADLLAKAPPGGNPVWSKGDPAAKVSFEEFADFSCPTCGQFHNTLKEIEKTYGSKIRITYRHFPLQIPGHENSYNAARAAEAAGIQGRFWEMQNMLFTNQKTWTVQSENDARSTFADYAKSIGIDVEKFKEDMLNNQAAAGKIADDIARGKAIKVNATPTVVLNGTRSLSYSEISSPDIMRQLIENELQKAGGAAPAPANSNSNSNAQ